MTAADGTNRLRREKSPYLLQHARNPVDWYPWGDAALERAAAEDRPVLLSIGYSTCHWCHVMASECFEDEAIAALMNRHFVCVKVDREERPDLDRVYMEAVTALTGAGGWPLNVFLTPEGHPFFGGTYFPPEARPGGRPSFPDVLRRIAGAWGEPEERRALREAGLRITGFLRERRAPAPEGSVPGVHAMDRAVRALDAAFDPRWGGFGRTIKFPSPPVLAFLLDYATHTALPDASEPLREAAAVMALRTLARMADGGICDHLGGGFHRYATDPRWRVPHFEKMLYDNAQLIPLYLRAADITGREAFAQVALGTADYLLREMTHPEGAFFCAQDADSLPGDPPPGTPPRKREGAFFLWRREEILSAAGVSDGDLFCRRYGVEPGGNVAFDPHGEFTGENVLYAARPVEAVARDIGRPVEAVRAGIERARLRLFESRVGRPRPHRDEKVLTAWNGLAVGALARTARRSGSGRHLDAARRAARFLLGRLRSGGVLYRRWKDGECKVPATAEDFFFLVQGLLDLYEADLDPRWLEAATGLAREAIGLFHDTDGGGFFMTRAGHDPRLILRPREEADLALPSAASVAALCLLRLARWTGDNRLERVGTDTIRWGLARFGDRPEAACTLLSALSFHTAVPVRIEVAGDPRRPETRALVRAAGDPTVPGKTLADAGRERPAPLGADLRDTDGARDLPAATVRVGTRPWIRVTVPERLAAVLAAVRRLPSAAAQIGD
jgi:uncharacterized protein YyaL (SSP411 family)